MEVVLEAERVVREFCFYYDKGLADELADLFTEDATFDTVPAANVEGYPLPAKGRTAIIEGLVGRNDYYGNVRRRHVVSNVVVNDFEGSWLRSFTVLLVVHIPWGGSPEVVQVGEYEDEMVLEGDRWRIASRRLHKDRVGPGIDSMTR